jgi:predicted ribonuclease YlaK
LYKALEEAMDRNNPFNKVTIIRSSVQSRDIGFLPGDADEKMEVYIQPYRQICGELFKRKDAWDRLVEQGHVEFVSTSFIRGTTFSNSIIVVDEVQNMTFEELDTIITRVGDKSKIIFCGDYRQTDLKKKDDKSGILKFFDIAGLMKEFVRIEFYIEDIVRSSLVKNYIIARVKYEDGN